MSFRNKILYLIDGLIAKNRTLPRHIPSGQPVVVEKSSIVFVFNYSSGEELVTIINFVKNARMKLELNYVVVYTNNLEIDTSEAEEGFFHVNRYDFNLIGRAKNRLADWLNSNSFDTLISFFDNPDYYCDKLVSGINSKFKAGKYHKKNVDLYDLTIVQQTGNYSKQLEFFIHYIDKLNINR